MWLVLGIRIGGRRRIGERHQNWHIETVQVQRVNFELFR
jgi:hypothetical protein